jgi:hypothetical protein
MPIGFKRRRWMAYLSVSASGPEFSPILEQGGRFYRPRMAADLRYTTADVDFLEGHFSHDNYDAGAVEVHHRLRNPTREQFLQKLDEVGDWLSQFRDDPDWDGGGFQLCFAGHGNEGDGALVLADGIITPNKFFNSLTSIASNVSPPGRLRLSVVLDSCHSGAFVTELLDACFNMHNDLLVPFHVFGSCMEDEFAWEESGLGHGVFTYCFSVREPSLGSLAATAIQPDNTIGPSLAIAAGELGCCLLTSGSQNPVAYWNGTGHLGVCRQDIDLFENGECMSLDEMRTRLKHERDKVVEVIRPMRQELRFSEGRPSEEEMRRSIHDSINFILSHSTSDTK